MKALLSFLLCVVFLHAETCFAQDSQVAANGGPNYGNLGDLVGTYAGIITPTAGTNLTNSLGLFDLVLTPTGIGTGGFFVFEGGVSFYGIIDAVGDPSNGSVQGIVAAAFYATNTGELVNLNTGVATPLVEKVKVAIASGALKASTSQAASLSSFGTRLTGTATVTVEVIDNILAVRAGVVSGTQVFDVDGFQQSQSTSNLTPLANPDDAASATGG